MSTFSFVTYMIYYPLVVAMFLLNCFADSEPTFSEYPAAEVSFQMCLNDYLILRACKLFTFICISKFKQHGLPLKFYMIRKLLTEIFRLPLFI